MTSKPTTILSITDRDSDSAASETDSTKSSLSGPESVSLDSEDLETTTMSMSQFLFLPSQDAGISRSSSSALDFGSLETISSDDEDDHYLTPQSSIHLSSSSSSISSHPREASIPTITVITPDTEVSYARESYSASSISHLLPSHFKEHHFVNVFEGDALIVLEELTEFLWIVRVCRTQMAGIIPAWNVEGEFERIARINMGFNSRMASPVSDFISPLGSPSSVSSGTSSSSSSASTSPSSTVDDNDDCVSALEVTIESLYVADESLYRANKLRHKSVGFLSTRPLSVYRYPADTYLHNEEQLEEYGKEGHHHTAITPWLDGWLEDEDEDYASEDIVVHLANPSADPKKRKARRGRKRSKKRVPS